MLPPNPCEGELWRVARRPHNWERLFLEGWAFLAENRRWDAEEREHISRASGLHQISPSEWANGESDEWWKAFAREYARTKDLNVALSNAVPDGR